MSYKIVQNSNILWILLLQTKAASVRISEFQIPDSVQMCYLPQSQMFFSSAICLTYRVLKKKKKKVLSLFILFVAKLVCQVAAL